MKEKKPQKQLLQLVMLVLLSVVSVLVTSNESFAALNCYDCHGSKTGLDALPLDTPAGSSPAYRNITTGAVKGNHQTHLNGLNITSTNQDLCARCHNNANYTSSHRSGTISLKKGMNFSTSGTYSSPNLTDAGTYVFKNQTSVPTLGSCSSVNCHFEALSPTWGSDPASASVINCSTCHASQPTTYAHTRHITLYGGDSACVKCHAARTTFQHATSAGNAGRNIDLSVIGSANYTASNNQYLPSQVATRLAGQCSNVYCHSSGQSANGASATPIFKPVAWSNVGGITCNSCHANSPSTGSHTKHTQWDGNCGNCHTGATANSMTSAAHVDGFINVSGSYNVKYSEGRSSARGNGYGTCNNASCHSPTTAVALPTPPWTAAASVCTSCHATGAAPTTGAHTKHTSLAGVTCEACHTGAGTGTAGGAGHFNGVVDVSLYPSGNVAKHAPGVFTATCTTSCHTPFSGTGSTPTWGVTGIACTSCHGNTAANLLSGAHTKHNALSTVTCATCHTGAGTGAIAPAATHGNGVIDVIGLTGGGTSTPKHASNAYAATCTVSCHNAYSTTVGIVTPTWGVTGIACTTCHGNTAATLTTGSHTKHLAHNNVNCASCHTNPGATGHVDQNVSVTTATGNYNGGLPVTKHASGSGYSSCSNTSCHNGGNGAGAFVVTAKTWGATLDCAGCHGYPPANTNHSGVLAGSCNGCHSNVVAGGTQAASTFVNPQLHLNGIVEGGRCDSCHGYPPVQTMANTYGTAGFNANYSSAKLQNYSGGGGVHSVAGHLALTSKYIAGGQNFTPCLTCHPQGATHAQGGTNFLTANVQVVVDTQFKFDKNRPIVYNAKQSGTGKTSGTCTNVACHFQKSPIWSTQTYTQGH